WAFIVKPILDVSKEHSVLSQLIYASSTILNLAILLGLLFIFNSKNFKLSSRLFFFLFFGEFCFIMADVIYLNLWSHHKYTSDHPVGILYNVSLFIIGITSYFSNGNVINTVDDLDGEQKNQLLEFRVWLPYLIVFFLFLFMVFKETKFNSIAIGLAAH
ncbi:MAG: hypothetical protein Q8934_20870, partial [Bacillota bacterium]|nr:hypothetical protein [Bacillota bacterium]